jgi:hypothetical protein
MFAGYHLNRKKLAWWHVTITPAMLGSVKMKMGVHASLVKK